MKKFELMKLLSKTDFHLDPLGRMVIDNNEILAAINGATNAASLLEDLSSNTACANNKC